MAVDLVLDSGAVVLEEPVVPEAAVHLVVTHGHHQKVLVVLMEAAAKLVTHILIVVLIGIVQEEPDVLQMVDAK